MFDFFFRNMCENEIGINARQSIAFIAELIPYNSNLKECLNELVTLDTESAPSLSARFLEILHECVTLIGKLVSIFDVFLMQMLR